MIDKLNFSFIFHSCQGRKRGQELPQRGHQRQAALFLRGPHFYGHKEEPGTKTFGEYKKYMEKNISHISHSHLIGLNMNSIL